MRVDRKRKTELELFARGLLDIECERDWPVGLGSTLGDGQNIKNYFSSFRDFFFREKPIVSYCWGSHIATINPLNLIKIVQVIFEKIKVFNLFLM